MRILITGVLGFIGSHCAKSLFKDHDVVGLDLGGDTKALHRIKYTDIRVMFKDLSKDASGILEGVDVVIHFAANTFVDHSIIDPDPFIWSNIVGTYRLLDQARRYKIKKFIHISTDEVYG